MTSGRDGVERVLTPGAFVSFASRAGKMMQRPVHVVAVDPGPTPGVALVGGLGASNVAVFQCDAPSVSWLVRSLLVLATEDNFRVLLAIERFIVGMRAAHSRNPRAGTTTRSMIGELAALGRDLDGVEVVQRSASEVMPWASDKRLKAAGLLEITKAMPHARAAARHALYTAVRDGGLPDPLSTCKGRAP